MTLHFEDAHLTVHVGDCREVMAAMPEQSVHCVVTSPPYWGLRDYGTATWEGGDEGCGHTKGSEAKRTWGPGSTGPSTLQSRPNNDSHEREGWTGGICRKCGARRIDSQLGLESTPEEYVANMVAVFREVRRVLRDDGTVWLNLGDSYAAARGGTMGTAGGHGPNAGVYRAKPNGKDSQHRLGDVPGLKPKDLCMIPARLAMALQEPYYTGRIKKAEDRAWLAAAIDGEGCVHISRRREGQPTGRNRTPRLADSFGVAVKVTNASEAFVRRCQEIAGVGTVRIARATPGERTFWDWTTYSAEARALLCELYPHIVAKRQEVRIGAGTPTSGPRAEAAWQALKALHRGESTDIDFPAPASMFEPGWYLRSDVIWSKLNPMPESVTDRPTKAHEYVFLLTKSARYWYDADAVREAYNEASLGRYAYEFGKGPAVLATANPSVGNGTGHRTSPNPAGRNLRTVWTIATQPYPGAHFAVFPEALVEPCVKAGCPIDGVVLDPFAGSGTTGRVANRLGRRAILIDLSAEYIDQAMARNAQAPLGLGA